MYLFGDSFDLYASASDTTALGQYWDTYPLVGYYNLTAGRYTGSQAITGVFGGAQATLLSKASGSNDAVHHVVIAAMQPGALSGTSYYGTITLWDGTTAQCTIGFRSDGAIVLVSGISTSGTVLATYTGAITASNTWFAFEFEIVVNAATGSFTVRKNGNPSNDFTLGSLNTAPSGNAYATKISLGQGAGGGGGTQFDDFLWRSDPAAVPWVGDVRCYVRRPGSDASVQFTPSSVGNLPLQPWTSNGTGTPGANNAGYMPFVAPCTGVITSVQMTLPVGATSNWKAAIYAASATPQPSTVLGTATPVSNPPAGTMTFNFPTPVPVTQGTLYYLAGVTDTASGTLLTNSQVAGGFTGGATFATFPVTNPTSLSASTNFTIFSMVNITPSNGANAPMVADIHQTGAATYVGSSTPGQSDLYGLGPPPALPASVVAVVTRVLARKSDAGTRAIKVQIKSGPTLSQGPSIAIPTNLAYLTRTDLVDPNTGSAWTPSAVNNLLVGQQVSA